MKNLFLLIVFFGTTKVWAQNVPSNADDELNMPPIDSLFAWADANYATIKIQDALTEKAGADTKRVRKSWMDAVKFSANISNGQYGNSVINQTQVGYGYGPSVSFSLYDIASNHDLVNVYKAEQRVATYKREEVIFELHKIITILYNNVQSQKNILRIKSEAVNAAYVHQKMAEKEFNQGAIALGELSRVTEIYTKTQTEVETTINDLKNYYMQLEQFCGRRFNNN
ncbi:MAG: TolC family protein [Bacteroidetes bacterium]|nr:TolC family protein [Bacteroidota bacterium]